MRAQRPMRWSRRCGTPCPGGWRPEMGGGDIARARDAYRLIGAEGPEQAFLDAISRGRLHHAWLLVGPEGVGKATFAYRAARRLLGARAAPEFGLLGASPDDPVSRQVAGRAHPDLL